MKLNELFREVNIIYCRICDNFFEDIKRYENHYCMRKLRKEIKKKEKEKRKANNELCLNFLGNLG